MPKKKKKFKITVPTLKQINYYLFYLGLAVSMTYLVYKSMAPLKILCQIGQGVIYCQTP